uniref:ATP-binding protein n=1 Tax=Nonomuraea candida TaxID=359159 RepID=UPI0005BC0625
MFVGRTAELALLHAELRAAAGGSVRRAAVEGPEGIGKTALIDRALSGRVAGRHTSGGEAGVRVLAVSGEEGERGLRLGVVRQLMDEAALLEPVPQGEEPVRLGGGTVPLGEGPFPGRGACRGDGAAPGGGRFPAGAGTGERPAGAGGRPAGERAGWPTGVAAARPEPGDSGDSGDLGDPGDSGDLGGSGKLGEPGGLGEPGEPDACVAGEAVCEVVGRLSARETVAVVVDDAQWVDRPSLRALCYLLRPLR